MEGKSEDEGQGEVKEGRVKGRKAYLGLKGVCYEERRGEYESEVNRKGKE